MQVMRDEKRRQLRYNDQESCDNFSIRSGGSRHRSVSLIGSQVHSNDILTFHSNNVKMMLESNIILTCYSAVQ